MDAFESVPYLYAPTVYTETLSYLKTFSVRGLNFLAMYAKDDVLKLHLSQLLSYYYEQQVQLFQEKRETVLLYIRFAYEQTMFSDL